MEEKVSKYNGIGWILLTAFCFGTMEIALKIGGAQFSAFQLNFLRFFIGGLLLLPLGIRDLKKRNCHLTKGDWLYLAILGFVGIAFSMSAFQFGVMHTNANLAAIIICVNPVFTMIFAHFLLHDPFTKKKALALALAVIGLVVVANPFKLAEGNEPIGIIMVMLAAISFGLYSAIAKLRIAKIGGPAQNSLSFLIGSLFVLIVILIIGDPVVAGINLQTLPVVAYVALVVTAIGYFSYMRAIDQCGPSRASITFFIKPILAVVLAAIILGEPITWNIPVGLVFTIGGCVYNMKYASVPAAPKEKN